MKGTGSHQGADTTPDYGRRLLPTLIDERARSNHSNPIASIPRTKNPQDGYVDISYARFANAINRCAPLAGRADGRSTTFENVAYMAATHIRYQILKIAAAKMGYVVSTTSVTSYRAGVVKKRCSSSCSPGIARRRFGRCWKKPRSTDSLSHRSRWRRLARCSVSDRCRDWSSRSWMGSWTRQPWTESRLREHSRNIE
jgi:hypothetical protein